MSGNAYTIGVFDSGVGGLNVLHALCKRYPQNTYLYLGDNARAPYGSRRAGEIVSFVEEALKEFESRGADAVVLACNTATAVALRRAREVAPFPVVGMEPEIIPAARYKKVAVFATPRTAESLKVRRLAARFPRVSVFGLEGLAAEIERKAPNFHEVDLSRHLPKGEFDAVVLGCTHYIWVKEQIAAFYGREACPRGGISGQNRAEFPREGENRERFPQVPIFDGIQPLFARLEFVLGLKSPFGGAENSELGRNVPEKWGKIGRLDHISPEGENPPNYPENGDFLVEFIGKSKEINKYCYKQMFVF